MQLIERIHEAQRRWNVLTHPFYERWDAGALTAGELRVYAGQYRHAVAAVASAACTGGALDDGGHAAEEAAHVKLWDAWAQSLGAAPAEPAPEAEACAEAWAPPDALAATAVLYAVESAQPAIAETKLRGLVSHYGFDEASPALEYFRLHAERDHEHARRAEDVLARETRPEDADRLAAAAEAALRANWLLLDGVERLNGR
ncbi:MAG: iron-containing redox enzyme family protein [Gaiellaceae bacterium]